ncbi:M16 family metallopeptidase [Glycomyces harbinensis]|uniref:Predicted Zn-dependent peptidase n=1 Tax=Glycomyces harbinensis TaxID=58114 RepID=A0A1G7AYV7_9ACTN|nr:pitrilysin family protein [Glycomyces harbinensis]SDE20074.1 Predicted Zn-dependent peptidase [Glycomyces harbinensis]
MSNVVPGLAPEVPLSLPVPVERTLPNGLRVLLTRRPGVPLAEVRLSIPAAHTDLAVADLLAAALFSGTETASMTEIAQRLQGVGGALGAGADPDRIAVSGNSLATGLPELLEVLGDLLKAADYPGGPLATEQARMIDGLSVAEQQPDFQVNRVLDARLWGDHPYGHQQPTAAEVAAVERQAVLALHASRIHPAGARLVIVGDIDTDATGAAVEKALGDWNGAGEPRRMEPLPEAVPGPLILVDRAGSVQSALRVAYPAVARTHPDNAAQHLANLVFGGYFSSRLVMNLRETKGYGYSPRSRVDHAPAGSIQLAAVDVATEVTGPALTELHGELRGMAERPPGEEELDLARRYALGSVKLATATQAGVANYISVLAAAGLPLSWLADHSERLREVTPADLQRVAAERLDPDRAVTVVLGDGAEIRDALAEFGEIEAR